MRVVCNGIISEHSAAAEASRWLYIYPYATHTAAMHRVKFRKVHTAKIRERVSEQGMTKHDSVGKRKIYTTRWIVFVFSPGRKLKIPEHEEQRNLWRSLSSV